MNGTRIFVGTDSERHKYYVDVRLGPDPLNQLAGRFQTTEHQDLTTEPLTLSMTYDEIDPRVRRDGGFVAGGAGVPEAVKRITTPAIRRDVLRRMGEIADRWHLNGMVAGCAHQDVVWEDHEYGRRPSLDLTPACPVTGYKYGHAWLVEILPDEIVAEIVSWGVPIQEASNA